MRHIIHRGVACTALIAVTMLPMSPAVADDVDRCKNASGAVAIAACTSAIVSRQYKGRNLADLFVARGVAYRESGQFDLAMADYDQAIKLDAKNAAAFCNRAFVYFLKSQDDRALQDIDHAIQLDPNSAVIFHSRAGAYFYKEDYDRAIVDYNEAIRLNPQYAVAFNDRGNAYFYGKKDDDRAIAEYDQAIRIKPDYAEAYINRGKVKLIIRDFAGWKADLERAKQLAH